MIKNDKKSYATAKRNIGFAILSTLKKYTKINGDHLMFKELKNILNKEYGLSPNDKTIFQSLKDLKYFGIKITNSKKGNRGYYLNQDSITLSEFQMLIDAVASIDNLSIDEKEDLYERLGFLLGFDAENAEPYLYESSFEKSKNTRSNLQYEDDMRKNLEMIYKALLEKKQLIYRPILKEVKSVLIDCDDDFVDETSELLGYYVNPYNLIININRQFCLLCSILIRDKLYGAIINLNEFTKEELFSTNRPANYPKELDTLYIINDLNMYEDAKDYRNNHKVLYFDFMIIWDKNLSSFYRFLQKFKGIEEIESQGIYQLYRAYYYYGDQRELIGRLCEVSDRIKVVNAPAFQNDFDRIVKGFKEVYLGEKYK